MREQNEEPWPGIVHLDHPRRRAGRGGAAMTRQIDYNHLIERIARRLAGHPTETRPDELRFGSRGSLSVKIGGHHAGSYYDHEAKTGGGALDLVCHLNGCRDRTAAAEWVRREFKIDDGGDLQFEAIYDYRDEDGHMLFQVCRKPAGEKPRFVQRRPEGDGWTWSTKGIRNMPYRLPELLDSPKVEPVFVVEGEKDADNVTATGLTATTNAGGAGKWDPDYARYFAGRDVVLVPDNDETGRNHMHDVGRSLNSTASSVRVLALPALPEKGDVSDWLSAGGSQNELLRLAAEAPEWLEPAPREDQQHTNEMPTIRLAAGDRPRIVTEAMDAIDKAGAPFYRRGLSIVHVAEIPARASDGANITTPAILTVRPQQLVHELGKAARWMKYDGRREDWVPADVPADVAAKIAALPNEWRFKPLAGIIATQTMRPDGSLLTEPGYDPVSGFLLFDPPPMPAIPDEPTTEQALGALDILDELLDEFPFVFDPIAGFKEFANPSRSVALSMLMTPLLRPALPPAVPLHVTSAPAPGTGKSYLADLASAIAVGERCPVITRSPSPEETEKRLVGAALNGQPLILIDNVNGDLRSEFLCQAVERPLLQVRALGTSELARIGNSATYFANGINIQIAEDLVRRTIQCRLDADMERPETRRFKYDPVGEVLADRGRYVAAVLTIARAYVVAGKPHPTPPFASFDRWSELVRGSLMWLGCADPVDTVTELSVADPIKNERAEIFYAIAATMPERAAGHTVTELIGVAVRNPVLADALKMVSSADGQISAKRLGKWLASSEKTIAGGFKLLRNAADPRRLRWQLVATK
jgi:putative DNA primase/helicase